jgi:hypothetical protein
LLVFPSFRVLSLARGDTPVTSGSWIFDGDEDSIDRSFTVLVRVIRRCRACHGPTAPCSLAGLLAEFRPCFTTRKHSALHQHVWV